MSDTHADDEEAQRRQDREEEALKTLYAHRLRNVTDDPAKVKLIMKIVNLRLTPDRELFLNQALDTMQ